MTVPLRKAGTVFCDPFGGEPPTRDDYILAHAVRFNPHTWRQHLPQDGYSLPLLSEPPTQGTTRRSITRSELLALGSSLGSGADAGHCLVAAVIWGSGTRSRWWPTTLANLLLGARRNETERHLWKAICTLREVGVVDAYAALQPGGEHHLAGIGPSFFTKLLYFAGWSSAAGDLKPLIMDRYVVVGLNEQRGTDWRTSGPWTSDQYRDYLEWAQNRAVDWGAGVSPDVVERRIWEYGQCLSRLRT